MTKTLEIERQRRIKSLSTIDNEIKKLLDYGFTKRTIARYVLSFKT